MWFVTRTFFTTRLCTLQTIKKNPGVNVVIRYDCIFFFYKIRHDVGALIFYYYYYYLNETQMGSYENLPIGSNVKNRDGLRIKQGGQVRWRNVRHTRSYIIEQIYLATWHSDSEIIVRSCGYNRKISVKNVISHACDPPRFVGPVLYFIQ